MLQKQTNFNLIEEISLENNLMKVEKEICLQQLLLHKTISQLIYYSENITEFSDFIYIYMLNLRILFLKKT